ncbi:MAG TPA: NAD(P)-binding domain-containing protein, partial [Gemmatimonadales bacterium]|nr:NAD(P)-binding domain-containing protein [Gemmatimonadales bacterium]
MTRIGVLGAGSWGTTLADLLARKGHDVRLWAYEAEVVRSVNERHENEVFLAGRALDPRLVACADPFEAVDDAPIVLSAAPSHVARGVTAPLHPGIRQDAIIVSATKGIEAPGLLLPHAVLAQAGFD